ncbi:MAG: hypothetical protein IAE92_06440 [Burkholderiaceae bacterium]|nr:hypothetical protein [Burkholderiaceae bacterium]
MKPAVWLHGNPNKSSVSIVAALHHKNGSDGEIGNFRPGLPVSHIHEYQLIILREAWATERRKPAENSLVAANSGNNWFAAEANRAGPSDD